MVNGQPDEWPPALSPPFRSTSTGAHLHTEHLDDVAEAGNSAPPRPPLAGGSEFVKAAFVEDHRGDIGIHRQRLDLENNDLVVARVHDLVW